MLLGDLKMLEAAQVYAEATPKGVAHPVWECDRSGEREAGGEFGEGEHESKSSSLHIVEVCR